MQGRVTRLDTETWPPFAVARCRWSPTVRREQGRRGSNLRTKHVSQQGLCCKPNRGLPCDRVVRIVPPTIRGKGREDLGRRRAQRRRLAAPRSATLRMPRSPRPALGGSASFRWHLHREHRLTCGSQTESGRPTRRPGSGAISLKEKETSDDSHVLAHGTDEEPNLPAIDTGGRF
jgi:hypothetical protein